MEPLVTSLTVPLRFVVGLLAAGVATLVMDAAGVLTGRRPDSAPGGVADAVHYTAGLLTGPLFVWLTLLFEGLVGESLVTTVIAAVVLYALMVGFFAGVVLPQSRVRSRRVSAIRRAWATEAAAYVLVLVPIVFVGSRLL
jgi:hypothetical protein